jgi:hypothetical protein
MQKAEVRAKVSKTLKLIKHKPAKQGGNGRVSEVQKLFADKIKWPMEVVVPTGKRCDGRPTCYKIDVANLELKIGVEIDGNSHCALAIKEQDAKKQLYLESLGWKIYRFKNREVLENLSRCVNMILCTI